MKAIWITVVLILTVLAGIGVGDPLCGALVRHPELDGDLEITSAQREDLEALYENTEKEIIESTGRMRIKYLEMERLMRSDDPDMREIRKLVNEIGDARSASMLAGIERNLKMKEILGLEQMRKAGKLIMRMGEGRGARYGERGFDRPGRDMRDHGMPGMQRCPRYGMMQGHGGSGMEGMGCHKGMMQGAEKAGKQAKGWPHRMMKKSGTSPEEASESEAN
jgi:Spy/CpxP family protein refolding chaperone